jgi:hypothetical protein
LQYAFFMSVDAARIAGTLHAAAIDIQMDQYSFSFAPAPGHSPCFSTGYCGTVPVRGDDRAVEFLSRLLRSERVAKDFIAGLRMLEHCDQTIALTEDQHRLFLSGRF